MKVGLFLALLAFTAGPSPDEAKPSRIARWFDGAAKETDVALEAWNSQDFETAREELESALSMAPEDRRARFNAGTGRLATDDLEAGLELLQSEADSGSDLAADSAFNLGNGFLNRDDLERAIQAYESALRHNPDHGDAKHNLEFALQQQEQQQQEKQQEEEDQEQQDSEDSEEDSEESEDSQSQDSESSQEGEPEEKQEEQNQEEQEQQEQGQSEQSQETPDDSSEPQQSSRLPSFENQEDMTAEQAAALLEAVENLEQEQRLKMAEEARAQRAIDLNVEKDW